MPNYLTTTNNSLSRVGASKKKLPSVASTDIFPFTVSTVGTNSLRKQVTQTSAKQIAITSWPSYPDFGQFLPQNNARLKFRTARQIIAIIEVKAAKELLTVWGNELRTGTVFIYTRKTTGSAQRPRKIRFRKALPLENARARCELVC